MATEGSSGEPGSGGREDAAATAAKREFDVDNLSQPELRMLLSIMEGELEARDLVIEALRFLYFVVQSSKQNPCGSQIFQAACLVSCTNTGKLGNYTC